MDARSRAPAWGPDGSWLVAESDAQGFSDLVMVRVGSREVRRLTQVREGAFEPALSPDGTRLAFVSGVDGDPELYLLELGAQAGTPRRLTFFHLEDVSPAWSPDGRWLAFLSNREGRDRVYVVRPDGTDLRAVSGALTKGDERELAWRPDSGALAFAERTSAGLTRLWLATLDGRAPTQLTHAKGADWLPRWVQPTQPKVSASDP